VSSELACIVTARAGETVLRKIRTSLTLVGDEPCPWEITLDNSSGDYNPSSSIANPRTYTEYLSITVDNESDTPWDSPDLVLEDYDYDTSTVTLTGRCRLSELDREDQIIGDFEDETVANILTAIAAEYGLTVTGAPTRTVKMFHAIGNPLDMFRELLSPTHTFRMGAGGQIVCESVLTHDPGPSLSDDEDLEILRFKRTSEIYNKATVERVAASGGLVTLFNEGRSGGSSLGAGQEAVFSEPTRNFIIRTKFGERGELNSIVPWSEDGPLTPLPLNQTAWSSTTPIVKLVFVYELNVSAATWGEYTPNWWMEVAGWPISVDPVPEEGYSQTAFAGAGDRPYPEPFTSISISSESDALTAAQALVELGTRQGTILTVATRLNPTKIAKPNSTIQVEDYESQLDDEFVVEATTISDDESGDTGTITIEATYSESA